MDINVLHPDTEAVIDNMVADLKAKLLSAQVKHGLVDGWRHPPKDSVPGDGRFFVTPMQCLLALHKHMEKGDALDCIAYLSYLRALDYSGTLTIRTSLELEEVGSIKSGGFYGISRP